MKVSIEWHNSFSSSTIETVIIASPFSLRMVQGKNKPNRHSPSRLGINQTMSSDVDHSPIHVAQSVASGPRGIHRLWINNGRIKTVAIVRDDDFHRRTIIN